MVQKITVVGAGIMGSGIAYTSALNGFSVVLQDIAEAGLMKAKHEIEKIASHSEEKGLSRLNKKKAL